MQYSIEILPRQFNDFLRAYRTHGNVVAKELLRVFVPHINGLPYQETLDCCEKLTEHGFVAVPHIAARNLQSEDRFVTMTETFKRIGIKSILMLGGDNPDPQYYNSIVEMLELSGDVFDSFEIEEFYFGTFPDGHPHTDTDEAFRHLNKKCQWVLAHNHKPHFISQVAFDCNTIINHLDMIAERKIKVPLSVGCVGPVSIARMIKAASLVGLTRAFKLANRHNLIKLITSYRLDNFIGPLVASNRISGIHLYPFGNYPGSIKKIAELVRHNIIRPGQIA